MSQRELKRENKPLIFHFDVSPTWFFRIFFVDLLCAFSDMFGICVVF